MARRGLVCKHHRLTLMLIMLFTAACSTLSTASGPEVESTRRLHHLVIVWLKQPGNADIKQRYIEASKQLGKLPGVLAYDVGIPASITSRRSRSALDESYDVAIAGVFESQQAYEAFLQNPEYARVAQQVLRPLVDKYQVYDFIE